jgi:glycosyltransferase involved in cell wall biosynthesis
MASTADPTDARAPSASSGLLLLVALPALDEERTVAEVIRAIPRDLPGISRVDVLVVDDGSRDRTGAEAEAAGATVLRHETPQGVGAAFGTALRHAIDIAADMMVSIDADGQFDPADIPLLVEPVQSGRADFASASRFCDPSLIPEMPFMKRWGNAVVARLVSQLTGQTFYDVSCGMRCYNRRAALSLNPIGRFTYTQEVFLNLAFKRLRIVEVPVAVRGEREFGESRVASNLWRYALNTSGIIFRCYRDYRPMLFFGSVAGVLATIALGLLAFLGIHYLDSGEFSPHKWAGFVGAAGLMLALLIFATGLIGDMLNRHRIYLEELLYRERERGARRTSRTD